MCAFEVSQDSSAKGINAQAGISARCETCNASIITPDKQQAQILHRADEGGQSTDPHSRTSVKVEQNIPEMSKDKLESLVKHMEETLSEMEQLKLHCGKQSEELSQLVVELRRENQELVEKYNQLAAEMKEAKEIIEQLQDTKYAFNAKERQAQKLSRQL